MIGIIVSLVLAIVIITVVICNMVIYNYGNELSGLFFLIIPLVIFGISIAVMSSPSLIYKRLLVTKATTEAKLEAFYKEYPEYKSEAMK